VGVINIQTGKDCVIIITIHTDHKNKRLVYDTLHIPELKGKFSLLLCVKYLYTSPSRRRLQTSVNYKKIQTIHHTLSLEVPIGVQPSSAKYIALSSSARIPSTRSWIKTPHTLLLTPHRTRRQTCNRNWPYWDI